MARENRSRASDELEPVRIDLDFLGFELASRLRSLVGDDFQSLAVNVTSKDSFDGSCDWRLNVPPEESKLYVALSKLIKEANSYYDAFVSLGTMRPQIFIVSVWAVKKNEPSIKGSWD